MGQKLLFTLLPFFPNRHSETTVFYGDIITKAIFFESLIFYDTVVVPTQGMNELLIFGEWLGYEILEELLRNKLIRFIQQEGRIVYSGETKELITIVLHRTEFPADTSRYFAASSMYSPPEAADIILRYGAPHLHAGARNRIAKYIENCSTKFDVELLNGVLKTTESELIVNNDLATHLNLNGKRTSELTGVKDNQLQVGIGNDHAYRNSEISNLMKLAFLNCLFVWGKASAINNFRLQNVFGDLTRYKANYTYKEEGLSEGVKSILTLKRLPDIQSMVKDQILDSKSLLDILANQHLEGFRKWLHNLNPAAPEEFPHNYLRAIEASVHKPDKISKWLNYTLITIVSMINPFLGTALSIGELLLGNNIDDNQAVKFLFENFDHLNKEND